MSERSSSINVTKRFETPDRSQFWSILLSVSPLLLAVAVYNYAVTLPFFLDDGPHFHILALTDGLQQWGDFDAFPFYRPFTFTLWKLFEPAGYPAPIMHLVNVLSFGMAGVLVGQITQRLTFPRLRLRSGTFAGWLFVLFPFSYQAVVMVAALFHLTLIVGLLLSLWAAIAWIDGRGGIGLLLLSWVAGFCGVFSHENGILLLPLLLTILLAVYANDRPSTRRLIQAIGPLLLIVGVYALLWLSFKPRGETNLSTDTFSALAVLIQGLIYPFAAALRPFMDGDIYPELLLALAGFITLAFLALTWWNLPQHLAGVMGSLAWYIVAIIPAAVALPAGYVLGQPRLALLASAGGSMFWALVMTAIFQQRQVRTFIPVLAFIIVSTPFLWMRRDDFLHLRDWNRQAVSLLEATDAASTGAVLVNAPDYITPAGEDRMFLLGTEGALFVDETLDYNQQFWMNSTTDFQSIDTYAVPAIQRNTGFNFRAHPPVVGDPANFEPFQSAPLLIVTQFDDKAFSPYLVGGTALAHESDVSELALFNEGAFQLQVAHATLDPTTDTMTIEAAWRVDEPAKVKLFLHVTCDGELIAQADGYPWGDLYPFAAWDGGDSYVDIRTIHLHEKYTIDCLQIYTGLYTEDEVIRLTAVNPSTDTRFADDAVPIPLEVTGQS